MFFFFGWLGVGVDVGVGVGVGVGMLGLRSSGIASEKKIHGGYGW